MPRALRCPCTRKAGFLFFNSYQKNPYDSETLHYLGVFGHLIILVITSELTALKNLLAPIKTAKDITHCRDGETGSQRDRMAHYAHLIATGSADQYRLDDQFTEKLLLFSPLHGIGKIGTPDRGVTAAGQPRRRRACRDAEAHDSGPAHHREYAAKIPAGGHGLSRRAAQHRRIAP